VNNSLNVTAKWKGHELILSVNWHNHYITSPHKVIVCMFKVVFNYYSSGVLFGHLERSKAHLLQRLVWVDLDIGGGLEHVQRRYLVTG